MDTIFALATAPIVSGVAIIRISGPRAHDVFSVFSMAPCTPRTAVLRTVTHESTPIDEALVLRFDAPHSFTGEPIVELHIHGSRAVMDEMLDILGKQAGFRLAEPGEFSRRAFENGKMDLTEAEGLADLIDAETNMQAKQALKQMQGHMRKHYDNWRQEIVHILARLEAYLDFPDEDLPESLFSQIKARIDALKASIAKQLNDKNQGEKLRDGLTLIVLGPPNAGKSSLINYYAKRDVAIVSDIAGTTRDLIEVHLNINGLPVTLIDTAGLRTEVDTIESIGIEKALERAKHADARLIMLDATAPKDMEHMVQEYANDNSLLVVNKTDVATTDVPTSINGISTLPISLHNEQGLDTLLEHIGSIATQHLNTQGDAIITRKRHRIALQEAYEHLEQLDLTNPLELCSEDLRRAAQCIGKITGVIDVEEILDEIFHNFCIGK